jgi:hypothetical protein
MLETSAKILIFYAEYDIFQGEKNLSSYKRIFFSQILDYNLRKEQIARTKENSFSELFLNIFCPSKMYETEYSKVVLITVT